MRLFFHRNDKNTHTHSEFKDKHLLIHFSPKNDEEAHNACNGAQQNGHFCFDAFFMCCLLRCLEGILCFFFFFFFFALSLRTLNLCTIFAMQVYPHACVCVRVCDSRLRKNGSVKKHDQNGTIENHGSSRMIYHAGACTHTHTRTHTDTERE